MMKKGERRKMNARKNKPTRVRAHKRPKKQKGRKNKNPAFGSDALLKQHAGYLLDLAALSFLQSLLGVGSIGAVVMGAISKPANAEDIKVTPDAGGNA